MRDADVTEAVRQNSWATQQMKRSSSDQVWLIDSAGARIDPKPNSDPDQISLFAGSGHLFREQVVMSGVVPQVAAMVGPGAAGTVTGSRSSRTARPVRGPTGSSGSTRC